MPNRLCLAVREHGSWVLGSLTLVFGIRCVAAPKSMWPYHRDSLEIGARAKKARVRRQQSQPAPICVSCRLALYHYQVFVTNLTLIQGYPRPKGPSQKQICLTPSHCGHRQSMFEVYHTLGQFCDCCSAFRLVPFAVYFG